MPDSASSSVTTQKHRWTWWRRMAAISIFGLFAVPKVCWRVLIIAYFVLAICFLLLRYAIAPAVSGHRDDIEAMLSASLGLKVQIAAVDADWDGLRPQLHIAGLRVFDQQGTVALELPRVNAAVSWSSLWRRHLELEYLEILEPDLTIRRGKNGAVYIAGLQINKPADDESHSESGFGDFVLQQQRISIRNAQLTWLDEQRGSMPLHMTRVSFLLMNSSIGAHHRFALLATPQPEYSAQLDVRGDIRGSDLNNVDEWRGSLYLRLDHANLAVWKNWLDYPFELVKGSGELQSWLDFDGRTSAQATTDIALRDVQVRLRDDLPLLDLVSLSGRVKAQRQLTLPGPDGLVNQASGKFSISGQDIQLAMRDGVRLAPTQFFMSHEFAGKNQPEQSEFASSALDVRVLAQLATYLPMPKAWKAQLVAAQPKGVVKKFSIGWQIAQQADGSEGMVKFKLDTDFEHLSLCPQSKAFESLCDAKYTSTASSLIPRETPAVFNYAIPGIEGLTGSIHGTEQSGRFDMNIRNGGLNLPDVMRTPYLALDQAIIQGRWGYEKSQNNNENDPAERLTIRLQNLALRNKDLDGSFKGVWQARKGSPGDLDFSGQLKQVQLTAIWRYLPTSVSKNATDWLMRGFDRGVGENAALRIKGPLEHFPFADNQYGIFQVKGTLRDTDVDFAPGWPALTSVSGAFMFEGERMLINTTGGEYVPSSLPEETPSDHVKLGKVRIEIPDLNDAGNEKLTVDGQATGLTSSLLDYVNNSRLADHIGSFTQKVRAQGTGILDIHVLVPLSHGNATTVKGSYTFNRNQLNLVPGLPIFHDTSGQLLFTEKGMSLPGVDAEFLGGKIHGTGVTDNDGVLRFDVTGNSMPVQQLQQLVNNPVWRHLEGNAQAQASIVVRKKQVEIAVNSDLVGITSNLPPPLAKSAEAQWPLSFSLQIDNAIPRQDWSIQLGQHMQAQWQDDCRGKDCHFDRGVLAFGASNARTSSMLALPDKGLHIMGDFDRIGVDIWKPVIIEIVEGAPVKSSSSEEKGEKDKDEKLKVTVDVHAAQAFSAGHVFRDATVHVNQKDDVWMAVVKGPDMTGKLSWQGGDYGHVQAQLTQLTLHPVTENDALPSMTPVMRDSLPALDIVADRFVVKNIVLGKLEVKATNRDDGWYLDHFSVDGADAKLVGEGVWRPFGDNRLTNLDFDLQVHDIGKLLTNAGYPNAVSGGKAQLKGVISWKGSPADIDYPSMSGRMDISASDGQFRKLDSSAVRLLGILSLQTLPRRIKLDFSDVVSSGLAFDSIHGSTEMAQGVMSTKDLSIVGPAAKIKMTGQIDIVNETQNLQVIIQPTLSEGVVIGTIAVQTAIGVFNPMVGVATYLAQKALQDPVEKLFSFKYAVTGSWNDPKVEKVPRVAPAMRPGGFEPSLTPEFQK